MKFREIFRFELTHQVRRLSTWLYVVVLFGFAFGVTQVFSPSEDVLFNAPSVIVFFTVFGGALWLLLGGATAGDAAARDVETGIDPLMYTAPISKIEYLGGRFAAAVLINALILLALPTGMLLGLHTRGLDATLLAPFRPAAYLTVYFYLLLPNAFVATAIQYSTAVRSRRAISSYLASVLLVMTSHLLVVQLLDGWEGRETLDLIGFAVASTEAWSPIEANTRVLRLEGRLLGSRLFWLCVALGALGFTYARFRFSHDPPSTAWRRLWRAPKAHASTPADARQASCDPTSISLVRQKSGLATHARQTLALASTSFRVIASSRMGLTLVAVLAMGSAFLASEWMTFADSIPVLARTSEVIRFLAPPLGRVPTLWTIMPLLTIFYAGELVWREREARVHEMMDATPVPESVLFLGKFLGLGLVIVTWLALLMAAGVLIQWRLGHPYYEVGLYVQVLFGLQLADYLLFALLVVVVHVLADSRHLGNLLGLISYAFIVFASRLGIEHHLLVYGAAPRWSYGDMAGFGPSVGPWLWFKLYWAGWAMLLAVTACLLWTRGTDRSAGARLQLARGRVTGRTVGVAAAAVGLIVAVGGFIVYNTHILNVYRTAAGQTAHRAEYEHRYGQYRTSPQPRLTATSLRVEIYPELRQVDIRGTYHMVNDTVATVDSIHMATAPGVETDAVFFDRSAALALEDDDHSHRIYKLDNPLQAGESLRLDFTVRVRPRGFRNSGIDTLVVANGTYFTSRDWLPSIGYQVSRELSGAVERRAHRLPISPDIPSRYDIEARHARPDSRPIDLEAIVATDRDQIAVAPGELRGTWTEGARRYFHYVTAVPIGPEYAFFSARYAVHEGRWDPPTGSGEPVAIQIFHHPAHNELLERMLRSVQASLSYYTTEFGRSPYRHIKIVEHPGHGRGMHADGSMIDYQEGFSHLNPRLDRDLDLPFHIVAHEVAHLWWGGQLSYAPVEGAGLLSESLATYSAMRLVEETLGPVQLARYLRFARAEYEMPRSRAAPPLLRASDAFHSYRKGPLALYALGEYIGKERVHEALARLLQEHASRALLLPTSLDLYRELQAVTPAAYQYLLHDLFEANTFWELATERVTAVPAEGETWQVTLDVRVQKAVVDETGLETKLPTDDLVEIGIYDDAGSGEPLYQQQHRVTAGTQTITVSVPRKPTRAGIDPRFLLMDWATDDNMRTVSVPR